MGEQYGPPTSLFNAYKLGKANSMIPSIPSLTGGSAGPSGALTGNTNFGGTSLSGGVGFFGWATIAIVGVAFALAWGRK